MPRKKKDQDIQMNKSLIPGAMQGGTVEVQITYNFILDLYDKSKDLEGEEREEMLQSINELTKHIGKWLVS
tara:strand:+ start:177 stop:389 length:213 start_codon:yes stop_codon:yes gene_type:complete